MNTKNIVEIVVPELGESIVQGNIASITKQKGSFITKDELLAVIETDKIAIEILSTISGIIEDIFFSNGDSVNVGDKIAIVKESDDIPTKETSTNIIQSDNNDILSSPAASKIMKEQNITDNDVSGTGKNNMITKQDILSISTQSRHNNIEKESIKNSQVTNETKKEKVVSMSNLRIAIAKNLKKSQDNSVTLSTFNIVNMKNIIEIRKKYKDDFIKIHNTKLGFMSFFVKASVKALQNVPEINAEIKDNNIIYKDYYNIGVAVGTDKGLVVPVLKNVERMSFSDIENQIVHYANLAKKYELKLQDMSGGTFTITNGGIYGSLLSTPIINPPQSGILGMHSINNAPIVNDEGLIVSAPMMYLALSYDHRIVDGKGAVNFLCNVKKYIEDPYSLMLDL